MWCAARRAYQNQTKPFLDYAILGDGVIIADDSVAGHYRDILNQIGVDISIPKSIISRN